MAKSINYSNRSITGDEIASQIRPTPFSISDLTAHIKGTKKINKLNLSSNCITLKGATQLINFIISENIDIDTIDLSYNCIELVCTEEYDTFIESLLKILPKINKINLAGNSMCTKKWIRNFEYEFGEKLSNKITICGCCENCMF